MPARSRAVATPAESPFLQSIQPRSDPEGFARWLAASLRLPGITRVALATEAGVEAREVDEALRAPYGTKGLRRDLYESALRLRARVDGGESQELKASAVRVHFTRKGSGGVMAEVVRLIGSAKKEVLVEAYSVTHPLFTGALIDAKRNDVAVRVIQDGTMAIRGRRIFGDHLAEAGIDFYEDPSTAHSKVLIIDRHTVATGSFNFTHKADKINAENLVVIRDTSIASLYASNWTRSVKRIMSKVQF